MIMKRFSKFAVVTLIACALASCGSSDDDKPRDMEKPFISEEGIVANPVACQEYKRGDVIPFNYLLGDSVELGKLNIEIHNNFDHHAHGTSAVDCPLGAKKTPVKAWVYNKDYYIPAGLKEYKARFDIQIPKDIDAGDYHFMIRCTDKAGWQELKAISIKIKE